MTTRWKKKQPTAAQKRAALRERELAHCQQGNHTFTKTFRPNEEVCLTCGLVMYCALCLEENKFPAPYKHAFPRFCPTHMKAEVKA